MLDDKALDNIFRSARTHNGWLPWPVTDDQLRAIYDVMKWGPTSANCQPARIVFVRTKEGKEKLRPALSAGNTEKTMTAPVTAIVAYDPEFYEHLPRMFPHDQTAITWFKGKPSAEPTAFRNGTLQGAYLIVAARALGLDCGPMSGFNAAAVDAAFWAGTAVRTNFLCCLGYGDADKLKPRNLRLPFEQACRIL